MTVVVSTRSLPFFSLSLSKKMPDFKQEKPPESALAAPHLGAPTSGSQPSQLPGGTQQEQQKRDEPKREEPKLEEARAKQEEQVAVAAATEAPPEEEEEAAVDEEADDLAADVYASYVASGLHRYCQQAGIPVRGPEHPGDIAEAASLR